MVKKILEKAKGKFEGETIFILGNGPSLNNYDLELLKDKYTMAFNRFYLADVSWKPTFYTVADEGIIQDYGKEIIEYIKGVQYPMFPFVHPTGLRINPYIQGKNITWYQLHWGNTYFSSKKMRVGLNGTVANVGIQIAAWLGFKTIYLLGVDMKWKILDSVIDVNGRDLVSTEYDVNHFTPEYFGPGHRWHVPKVETMLKKMAELSEYVKTKGGRLINLNPDSAFINCEFGDYERVLQVLNGKGNH